MVKTSELKWISMFMSVLVLLNGSDNKNECIYIINIKSSGNSSRTQVLAVSLTASPTLSVQWFATCCI